MPTYHQGSVSAAIGAMWSDAPPNVKEYFEHATGVHMASGDKQIEGQKATKMVIYCGIRPLSALRLPRVPVYETEPDLYLHCPCSYNHPVFEHRFYHV